MRTKQINQDAARDAGQTIDVQTAIAHCVMKAALVRLNECRTKCPGIGGDVDAMNLRHMIQSGLTQSAGQQAARTLRYLSRSLDIKAEAEIVALEAICDIHSFI